jgi:hypothetical protein
VPLQYRLGDEANICRIGLPLLGVDAMRLAEETKAKASALAGLPRPLTVFLAGGSTGSHSLDPERARDILASAQGYVARDGGSLYVSTSRRTPEDSVRAIRDSLPEGAKFYRWAAGDENNPYLALLGHGDRFIVTGDSISMLVEVARLGKPLAIADLRPANRTVAQALARLDGPPRFRWAMARLAGELIERTPWGTGSGTRDFDLLHEVLYRNGWAVRLGETFKAPMAPPPDDAAIAAKRLLALLGEDEGRA